VFGAAKNAPKLNVEAKPLALNSRLCPREKKREGGGVNKLV